MNLLADVHFWEAVAFFLAVALVWKKASAAINAALDQRAAKIREELDQARRLREEAQQTLANYQRKQRDALKEAEKIIEHAKAEAERLGAQAARDLEAATAAPAPRRGEDLAGRGEGARGGQRRRRRRRRRRRPPRPRRGSRRQPRRHPRRPGDRAAPPAPALITP
jgi:hypothetical protein